MFAYLKFEHTIGRCLEICKPCFYKSLSRLLFRNVPRIAHDALICTFNELPPRFIVIGSRSDHAVSTGQINARKAR